MRPLRCPVRRGRCPHSRCRSRAGRRGRRQSILVVGKQPDDPGRGVDRAASVGGSAAVRMARPVTSMSMYDARGSRARWSGSVGSPPHSRGTCGRGRVTNRRTPRPCSSSSTVPNRQAGQGYVVAQRPSRRAPRPAALHIGGAAADEQVRPASSTARRTQVQVARPIPGRPAPHRNGGNIRRVRWRRVAAR